MKLIPLRKERTSPTFQWNFDNENARHTSGIIFVGVPFFVLCTIVIVYSI